MLKASQQRTRHSIHKHLFSWKTRNSWILITLLIYNPNLNRGRPEIRNLAEWPFWIFRCVFNLWGKKCTCWWCLETWHFILFLWFFCQSLWSAKQYTDNDMSRYELFKNKTNSQYTTIICLIIKLYYFLLISFSHRKIIFPWTVVIGRIKYLILIHNS